MLKLYPSVSFVLLFALALLQTPVEGFTMPFTNIPNVTLTKFPKEKQLFPRNLNTNLAKITISGYESAGGFSHVMLRVFKSGRRTNQIQKVLSYGVDGTASFEFSVDIKAELANYDFELHVKQGRKWILTTSAKKVVAGDIYIIQGQSNAFAAKYDGSAAAEEHIFIRSYGSISSDEYDVETNREWHYANADNANLSGAVGQWGVKMARILMDTHKIPIAVLNGAQSGKEISHFQRNDGYPDDLETNYGRLRYRVQGAGAGSRVRGIFWYQGEADAKDGRTTSYYKSQFIQLYEDWKQDFPNLEKIYVMQIRTGCFYITSPNAGLEIQEAQRQLAESYGDIEIMTAKGIPQHIDACHNAYSSYMMIGERMAGLVSRDLYGGGNNNVSAPQIQEIQLIGPRTLKLIPKNSSDLLFLESGAISDFKLEGSSAKIIAGEIQDNAVILYLSQSYTSSGATGISYWDHATYGYKTGYVKNSKDIGLVSFKNLPVKNCATTGTCPYNSIDLLDDYDYDGLANYADSDDDNDFVLDGTELNCQQGYFAMSYASTASTSSTYTSPIYWNSKFNFQYAISSGSINNQTVAGEIAYLGYNVPNQYEKAKLEIILDNPMDWLYVQMCDIDQNIKESVSIQFYNGNIAVTPNTTTFGTKVESLGGGIFRSKSTTDQTLSCASDNRVDFQFNIPVSRIVVEGSSEIAGNADVWLRIGSCLYDRNGNSLADYQDNPDIVTLARPTSSTNKAAASSYAVVPENNVSFVLYPNPASDRLVLNTQENTLKGTITINDMLGRVVKHVFIENVINYIEIETADLETGNYVLTATLGDGSRIAKRFIKQ